MVVVALGMELGRNFYNDVMLSFWGDLARFFL
jgi:hypothetical protein